MSIVKNLQEAAAQSLIALYAEIFTENDFQVNKTKPEFEGDYTIVLFSLVKKLKRSPEVLGKELGEHMLENYPDLFADFNVIKGFLNLSFTHSFLHKFLDENYNDADFGKKKSTGKKIMVEYSSPNTNKPLHLGHLRNNFLGWSVAEILKANGNEVIKSCIVNDRGIHICKSMRAWMDYANGETPESKNVKGDHFVGDLYVIAETIIKQQSAEIMKRIFENDYSDFDQWERSNVSETVTKYQASKKRNDNKEIEKYYDDLIEVCRKNTFYMKLCQQMLVDWEDHKPEVIELWSKMNGWVYKGFDTTYKRIGSDFDVTYYESNTYLLGKKIIEEGLAKNVFVKEDDGSIWIDLTEDGLDKKIVQRKDGTSVYITQDIGLAEKKYEEYKIDKSIYVIGDEQNYHMKVLKLIAEKLHLPNAKNIFHLSYGMVELPTGKMKSREGTVVDADDLLDEMKATAKQHTEELGKVKDFEEDELEQLYETISLGATKFYLLRVDPKKKMVFNPEESIDFHGFTGPFVQYTYARIKSILRKVDGRQLTVDSNTLTDNQQQPTDNSLTLLEKELILTLEQYITATEQAAAELNPSVVVNYVFNLAKTFNSFYVDHSIANAESEEKKQLRLRIAGMTANVIKSSMKLLGIDVPERM